MPDLQYLTLRNTYSDLGTKKMCYCSHILLREPGAVSGEGEKSKRVRKNSGEEKSRTRRRAPGARVLKGPVPNGRYSSGVSNLPIVMVRIFKENEAFVVRP